MDRGAKADLARRLSDLAQNGTAVLVATHDAEFAAAWAQRVVLLADGRPIADASVAEVLAGGWYFATETARILGGEAGALRPEEGAAVLRSRAAHAGRPLAVPPAVPQRSLAVAPAPQRSLAVPPAAPQRSLAVPQRSPAVPPAAPQRSSAAPSPDPLPPAGSPPVPSAR